MHTTIELLFALLILLSLILALSYYVLQDLPQSYKVAISIFDLIIVLMLVADFSNRVKNSPKKAQFLIRHWYEFPAMVPLILFNLSDTSSFMGAALDNLRIIVLFRTFRLYDLVILSKGREIVLLIIVSVVTVISGGIAMYLVEAQDPNANIRNIGDGVWWAIVTAATVGYGDRYPVTTEGRIIAVIVMILGIGVLATLISTIAKRLIASQVKKAAGTGHDTK